MILILWFSSSDFHPMPRTQLQASSDKWNGRKGVIWAFYFFNISKQTLFKYEIISILITHFYFLVIFDFYENIMWSSSNNPHSMILILWFSSYDSSSYVLVLSSSYYPHPTFFIKITKTSNKIKLVINILIIIGKIGCLYAVQLCSQHWNDRMKMIEWKW